MFVFSFVIPKHLISQRSLKLFCKNIPLTVISLKYQCQLAIPELPKKDESTLKSINAGFNTKSSDIILINKIINESRGSNGITWEEVIKKLKVWNVPNVNSVILQLLLRLPNVDEGVNFYSYWIKSGEKFSLIDAISFLKLISSRKDLIHKNETLIKYIYDNIKEYLLESKMIQDYLIEVILEVPYCFYDFVKSISEKNTLGSRHYLLTVKALELNKPEIAWNIVKSHRISLSREFDEAYMNFFIRMAKKGQFSPELVTQLTESYENVISILEFKNLDSHFDDLIQIANKNQNEYIWSAKPCEVNDGVCSNCKFTLVDKQISETEFDNMKKDFLSQIGLFHHSVFLSTSNTELKNFIKFLNGCKPYNIVLDALNIIHKGGYVKFHEIFHLIKLLVNEGFSVLVIGRQHISKRITSASFLQRKEYADKVQYFFSSNLSDDDVFVLYATLHGGLGTYFLSNDLLSRYSARLSADQRLIFMRWKVYHQFMRKENGFVPSRRHLGVPQLTTTPDQNGKKFIWHISSIAKKVNALKLTCATPIKWTCVQAEIKKRKTNL